MLKLQKQDKCVQLLLRQLGKKKEITHRIVNDKEKKEKNDKEKISKYNA